MSREGAASHSNAACTPRQVSELCTFRLTPTHMLDHEGAASQPAASQTRAVRAHAARPLGDLAQRTPGQPRHPGDWADPRTAPCEAPRRGGRRRPLSRTPGHSAEFPCLANRAAGHCSASADSHSEPPRAHLSGRVTPSRPTCMRVLPPHCAPQHGARHRREFTRATTRKVGVLAWRGLDDRTSRTGGRRSCSLARVTRQSRSRGSTREVQNVRCMS